MRILIGNDDGVTAAGLSVLVAAARRLAREAQIIVVAPGGEQSGASQRISLGRLSATRLDPASTLPAVAQGSQSADEVYAVAGTPCDCVRVALGAGGLLDGDWPGFSVNRPVEVGPDAPSGPAPDLVLSGINHGLNIGHDVNYSGTVGVAAEAAAFGLPAVALSIERAAPLTDPAFADATAGFIAGLLRAWFADGTLSPGRVGPDDPCALFSVNMPSLPIADWRGVMVTRQAGYFLGRFERYSLDAEGAAEFAPVGGSLQPPSRVDARDVPTDQTVLTDGFVCVTPLVVMRTDIPRAANLRDRASGWWQTARGSTTT
jgi:5'-nucleotidase